MKPLLALALAVLCSGCLLDSIEPWLSPATIVESEIEVDGDWSIVDEVELFGGAGETTVTLTRKPATERRKESFALVIRPKSRDTQFVFRATVHEIDDLRFLQISNFTHFDEHLFGLAHRPTYSLWRVEADRDNVLIWMPELGAAGEQLKTLRDQDDKTLFVDSASSNEAAIRDWARAQRNADERPRRLLALALTRNGTPFTVPASARPHVPAELAGPARPSEG